MPQTRQKVFRIVPICPNMSQNVPKCFKVPKMSTSDASLSERTCFYFGFTKVFMALSNISAVMSVMIGRTFICERKREMDLYQERKEAQASGPLQF